MRTAAIALQVDIGGRHPPAEFRIFPAGIVRTRKGDFLFDEQAAASVMEAYRRHAVDLMIDYDHAALSAPAVKAIAAGWFNLEVRNGELWATNVRWTFDGASHLAAAEYRYFSPLFHADDLTGRIIELVDNALTNTPAMDGIEALVAASANHPSRSGGHMSTSTAPSDDQVTRAYRASIEGGRSGATSPIALSALGGPVQARSVLEQASDLQLIQALNSDEVKIMTVVSGGNQVALARQARQAALAALSRHEREAGAALIDAGRRQASR